MFFSNKNLTCIISVNAPVNPEKVGKLIPIPYANQELILDDIYLNLTSNKLVKIKCSYSNNIFYNCDIVDFNSECENALSSNSIEKALKNCEFRESDQITPKLTKNGILVPYNEQLTFFNKINDTTSLPLDIDFSKKSPMLIITSKTLKIIGKAFHQTFSPFSTKDDILYSKYTPEDIQYFADYLQRTLNLSNEEILIISQTGIGLLFFGVVIMAILTCCKLYKKNALLNTFQSTLYNRKEPKSLRKFLQK